MSIVEDERATAIRMGSRRRIQVSVYADPEDHEIKAFYRGEKTKPTGDVFSGSMPPHYLLFLLRPDKKNGVVDVMFVGTATDAFVAKPGKECPMSPAEHDTCVFPAEYLKLNETRTSLEAFNRNPASQEFKYKLSILVKRDGARDYEPKELDPRIINQ